MKKGLLSVVLFLAVLVLPGCASVPKEDSSLDTEAKLFKEHPDRGALYFYRDEFMGGTWLFGVEINGITVANTAPMSFFKLDLAPGRYRIISRLENVDAIEVDLKKGDIQYVWQKMKVGWRAGRSELHLVEENEGQSGVLNCSLIKTSVRGRDISPLTKGDVNSKIEGAFELYKSGAISLEEYRVIKDKLLSE